MSKPLEGPRRQVLRGRRSGIAPAGPPELDATGRGWYISMLYDCMIMHRANDTPIRVAVLGASGYSGGELLRLLAAHPGAELVAAGASERAGKSVADVHPT